MRVCFMFFISSLNIVLEEKISFDRDIRGLIIAFLYRKWHSLLMYRVQELIIEFFFISRGSEVIIISVSINENI